MADDATIAGAKRGDADAWNELYLAHAGRLLLWLKAREVADSAVAADDVASEAWLVAARRVHQFHGTREQFAGWLFGIGRRVSANQVRRSALRVTTAIDDTPDRATEAGPEEAVTGFDWVRDQLAGLPKRERDVLACMEVVGLDATATAQALGMTAVAVRVARHRGLKRLRIGLDTPAYPAPAVPAQASDCPQPSQNLASVSLRVPH